MSDELILFWEARLVATTIKKTKAADLSASPWPTKFRYGNFEPKTPSFYPTNRQQFIVSSRKNKKCLDD